MASMSVQEALQVAGIISFVVAGILALLTVHSFVSEDIPSVLDDLSGKRRQRELGRLGSNRNPRIHADLVLKTPVGRDVQEMDASEHDNANKEPAEEKTGALATSEPAFFDTVFDVVLCGSSCLMSSEGEIL